MRPRLPHNVRRLARISLQNIGRNLLLAVATTVMMGLIVFIFNVIWVLNILTESSLNELAKKIDLIVYLNDKGSLYEINSLVTEVTALPMVEAVEFTSSEEALKEFTALYPEKADPFSVYGIENPLPANLRIVTENPDQHDEVLTSIKNSAYGDLLLNVESSNENEVIATRLLRVTEFTENLMIGVVVTFILGSLLMIMNAIHLSIFTRKTEIQVMQLVGAKPSMIHLPFLFEGGFYSLIAVLFSFFFLNFFLKGTALSSSALLSGQFKPWILVSTEIGLSVGVGIIASYIATRFYLKQTLVLEHA